MVNQNVASSSLEPNSQLQNAQKDAIVNSRVCNTVLWEAWRFSDGAEREGLLGRKRIEGALEAACDARKNDTSLARETLSASIDDGDDSGGVWIAVFVYVNESTNSGIEPASSFNIVQT